MLLYVQSLRNNPRKIDELIGNLFTVKKKTYCFRFGWLFYIREVQLQYMFAEISFMGLFKETIKLIFAEVVRLPLPTLLFFFVLRVYDIETSSRYVAVDSEITKGQIWISRQSILGNLLSDNLDSTLDYDFHRLISRTHARIWGTSAAPISFSNENLVLRNSKTVHLNQNTLIGEETRNLPNLIQLRDSIVHHGRFLSANSTVVPINSELLHPSHSWPNDTFAFFQGKSIVFSAISTLKFEIVNFIGISKSWYHFLVEYFPRYLFLPESQRGLPTVLPKKTPHQILELLKLIGYSNLIEIECRTNINANRINSVQDFRFANPFDFQSRQEEMKSIQGFFSNINIGKSPRTASKRLLIARPETTFRKMANFSDVEKRLHSFGFQTIQPDSMSAKEQIDFFRSAEIVAGQSGAALTSLFFCNNGTKLIELADWSVSDEQFFWREFATILNIEIDVVYAKPKSIHRKFDDSFEIDLSSLERVLNSTI